MIELIAAAVSGAVVGGGVVWTHLSQKQRDIVWFYSSEVSSWSRVYDDLHGVLTALRSNCFIPDERGVKVRYSQASVERRVKAETQKEVV